MSDHRKQDGAPEVLNVQGQEVEGQLSDHHELHEQVADGLGGLCVQS